MTSSVPSVYFRRILFTILVPLLFAILWTYLPTMSRISRVNAASKYAVNVIGGPIGIWSEKPMTGFYRNGYCHVGPEDFGNHSIAAILSDPFLDFTASRGNNLRAAGLKAGCKWCLCAGRWKEAFEFAKSQSNGDANKLMDSQVVPRVNLDATNIKALDVVQLEELKMFASNE